VYVEQLDVYCRPAVPQFRHMCDGEEGEGYEPLSPATDMRGPAGGSDVGWTEVDMLTFYVGVDNFAHPVDRSKLLYYAAVMPGY
jgi:hypothetical protein